MSYSLSSVRGANGLRTLASAASGAALCWALSQPALAQQAKDESWARDVVVVTGQARVFKLSPGGREQVLTLDGPGSSVA